MNNDGSNAWAAVWCHNCLSSLARFIQTLRNGGVPSRAMVVPSTIPFLSRVFPAWGIQWNLSTLLNCKLPQWVDRADPRIHYIMFRRMAFCRFQKCAEFQRQFPIVAPFFPLLEMYKGLAHGMSKSSRMFLAECDGDRPPPPFRTPTSQKANGRLNLGCFPQRHSKTHTNTHRHTKNAQTRKDKDKQTQIRT